jgi:hypothetical protein
MAPPFNPRWEPFGPSRLSRFSLSTDCFSPFERVSRSTNRRRILRPLLTSAVWSENLAVLSVSNSGQNGRSPEVSVSAFHAQPPNLRFAPLMDLDFAVNCQLVRRSRLRFGFYTSARVFAPCFFQTTPRDSRPCTSLILHLHRAG